MSLGLAVYGREKALIATVLVFVGGWALYVANWSDVSFRELLHRGGLDYPEWQLWQFTDGLQGLAILAIGGRRWWSISLVALFCVQEIAHDFYGRLGLYDWQTYTGFLNSLFLMQIAVLMLAGLTEGGDDIFRGHRLRSFRRVGNNA